MKKPIPFAVSFLVAVLWACTVFSQSPTTTKIGLINSEIFYSNNAGIKDILNAYKTLNIEFASAQTVVEKLATDLTTRRTELRTLYNERALQSVINSKQYEIDKLEKEIKYKEDDFKAQYAKKEQILLDPIINKISKAILEFAKNRGFSIIMDLAKLNGSGIVLAIGDDKVDVSKEFISYYNSK